VGNFQKDLRIDLKIGLDEHIQSMANDAFRGIFNRNHAVIGTPATHLLKNGRDAFLRHQLGGKTELFLRSLVGEGRRRPEKGNFHGLLQRQRSGNDFPEHTPHGF